MGGVMMIVPCCLFSQKTIPDGTAGEFWRITPTVNWYLTEFLRFGLSYGYGILDRFNLKGATQFFQSRIAFTLR
jgi:phosphate-selective porin OprO/OprP